MNILFGAKPGPAHCFQLSLQTTPPPPSFAHSLTHTGVFGEGGQCGESERGEASGHFSSSFLPFSPATLVLNSTTESEREGGGKGEGGGGGGGSGTRVR